jgi:hypothetical protein
MERIKPYIKHSYKHNIDLFVLVDRENYELSHVDDMDTVLYLAVEVLLTDRFVKVIQGPGPWLVLDLDKGVEPGDEPHSDKIPPYFWKKLDDETRKKLT